MHAGASASGLRAGLARAVCLVEVRQRKAALKATLSGPVGPLVSHLLRLSRH